MIRVNTIPRSKCGALWSFIACVLVLGVATAQPSDVGAPPSDSGASEPLPLPESPATTCTGATFHEAVSKAPTCSDTMYHYKDPEPPCCAALYEYYGVNSTQPSRNCFCYEPYWTRLQELEETTYIQLMAGLDLCGTLNYTIAYYQDGAGPCAGKPVEEASVADAPVPKARSLGQWLRDLDGDGLMAFSFTLGLISAVGFVAMLWPLVIDSVVEVHKMLTKRRSSL